MTYSARNEMILNLYGKMLIILTIFIETIYVWADKHVTFVMDIDGDSGAKSRVARVLS